MKSMSHLLFSIALSLETRFYSVRLSCSYFSGPETSHLTISLDVTEFSGVLESGSRKVGHAGSFA